MNIPFAEVFWLVVKVQLALVLLGVLVAVVVVAFAVVFGVIGIVLALIGEAFKWLGTFTFVKNTLRAWDYLKWLANEADVRDLFRGAWSRDSERGA